MSSSTEQNGAERNGAVQPQATAQDIYDAGMVVRREVLGNEHVDRANANKDSLPRTTRT